ncbi:hypothetical protein M501DRAFT_866590 [Patellaria atrata CBS 101060]|uniref:Uncharacterized protein n=1 Tax=Patellaria atrata CBS 101060 TaxID=1346257 RepID=A0A9P4VM63_9PEZI|nr:hypothetical protein M501DRAFT_866590 [Patellaria atrata CBS 101060]
MTVVALVMCRVSSILYTVSMLFFCALLSFKPYCALFILCSESSTTGRSIKTLTSMGVTFSWSCASR